MSRQQEIDRLVLEKARLHEERERVDARFQSLLRRADEIETMQRALDKTGSQDALRAAWLLLAARDEVPTGFLTSDPTEDYILDLSDFLQWCASDDASSLVQEGPAREHEAGKAYNYSLFAPTKFSVESDDPAGLILLGASWKSLDERPGVLIHAILHDPESGKHFPVLYHLGDEVTASTDAPREIALSVKAKKDLSTFVALMNYLPDYVDTATFEIVERRPPKPSVMEKAGFKKRAKPASAVVYKILRAVRRIRVGVATPREGHWGAPTHKVPVLGFWRKIRGVGRDREGNPILGKTWVRAHTRWNDKPDTEHRVIYVKEPLARPEET